MRVTFVGARRLAARAAAAGTAGVEPVAGGTAGADPGLPWAEACAGAPASAAPTIPVSDFANRLRSRAISPHAIRRFARCRADAYGRSKTVASVLAQPVRRRRELRGTDQDGFAERHMGPRGRRVDPDKRFPERPAVDSHVPHAISRETRPVAPRPVYGLCQSRPSHACASRRPDRCALYA